MQWQNKTKEQLARVHISDKYPSHNGHPGPIDSLFIQETFVEHILYFRHDSGYHSLRTMQKAGQTQSLPSGCLHLCVVHISGGFPQCLLVWIPNVKDWIGSAHLALAGLTTHRCWPDGLIIPLAESAYL